MAAQWCKVSQVRDYLPPGSEAIWDDPKVTEKIEVSTARLGFVFCRTVDLPDPEQEAGPGPPENYPTDLVVQEATAIMTARVLQASGTAPPSEGVVTSERLGSYGYTSRAGTGAVTALSIDSALNDLVGGYLCPGVYGSGQTDIYPLESSDIPARYHDRVTHYRTTDMDPVGG